LIGGATAGGIESPHLVQLTLTDQLEVTPEHTAAALSEAGATVIDVREPYEREAGLHRRAPGTSSSRAWPRR
jgi:rhodanese-related sulfurtransferase